MDMPFIGVLPAAGHGRRLGSLRYPKELLPIAYEHDGAEGVRARAVAEYAIEAIRRAEVTQLLLIVAPWKLDILGYVGDGGQFGVDAGYLYQEEARGLPHALDLAWRWCAGRHTVFAMPDTIFEPRDALRSLRALYLTERADLALAVFPTSEPRRLGPVLVQGRRVRQVLDKPAVSPVANTWGTAIWGPAFAELLHTFAAGAAARIAAGQAAPTGRPEPALGDAFQAAVRCGMKVVAMEFPDGAFYDAGTPAGLLRSLDGATAAAPAASLPAAVPRLELADRR